MRRIRIVGIFMLFAVVAAACGGGGGTTNATTAATGGTTGTATTGTATTGTATSGTASGPLAKYGESTDADLILAAIARANQNLDQATIDKALECWNATECDTGTGGKEVMGYADGGGLNVWRKVTRMEAILQALTYPEIGKMMFRDAQWNPDPSVAA